MSHAITPAAIDAAHAALANAGFVQHHNCLVGPDDCKAGTYERAAIADAIEAALAALPSHRETA